MREGMGSDSEQYRSDLAGKLKDVRKVDKELAGEYLAKTKQTSKYQSAEKEKRSGHSQDEEEKQNKIAEIRQEINEIIPDKWSSQVIEKRLEDLKEKRSDDGGEIEFLNVILKVMKDSENGNEGTDNDAFGKLVNKFDEIKEKIKSTAREFKEKTGLEPTIDNMIKRLPHDSGYKERVSKRDFEDPEKSVTLSIDLSSLSKNQKAALLTKFGIYMPSSKESVMRQYNNYKGFFSKKVKPDSKKYDFNLPLSSDSMSALEDRRNNFSYHEVKFPDYPKPYESIVLSRRELNQILAGSES